MLKCIMSLLASFMNLAGPDLIIILLIVLVLFGAKKLPELARGMGQAVKEFQKAKDEFSDELHKAGKSEMETAKSDVKPAGSTGEQRSAARCKSSDYARRQSRSGLVAAACSPTQSEPSASQQMLDLRLRRHALHV